jgi:hypothetical protein
VGNDRNIANWGAFAVAAHDVLGWEGGKFETWAGAEDRRAYPACLSGVLMGFSSRQGTEANNDSSLRPA